MGSFWEKFMEWQNYMHYVLLSIIISGVSYFYGAPIDFKMFGIILLTLFIGDSIVHGVFWFLPEPFRWRD
jgi:hypothetical protein